MDRLVNACNGKTFFQGGLNLTQFKVQLINQFPNNAEQIKELNHRKDLQSVCLKLLESAPQVQCLCLKSNGKQCTRNVSNKQGYDIRFCWQHQNCQKIIAPITKKSTMKKPVAKKVHAVPAAKKVPAVPITKQQITYPIIDLYEFKIEKYSKKLNPFSAGFKMTENQCGRIFTDNLKELPTTANLSSCDLIETDKTTDWEKILNEDFHMGYQST